jgi:monoamine oxidase
MKEQTHFDVIVVGAGAAGMAAAQALSAAGITVAVLEARARIGGRILTVRTEGSDRPLELGAEFVQGRVPETLAIAERAGLALCEVSGDDWWSDAQGLHAPDEEEGEEEEDEFGPFFKAIHEWQGEDLPLRAFLEQRFPGERWQALRSRAIGYAQGYEAGDAEDVSIRWLAEDSANSQIFEGRSFRVLDGYDRVIEQLRVEAEGGRFTLLLETPVRELRWSAGQVEAVAVGKQGAAGHAYSARAAIVTLPLGVLNAPSEAEGAVRFAPEIAEKREQLAGLRMGHTAKVLLRFEDVFWDRLDGDAPQLPQLSFLFSGREDFPTWWTSYPIVEPVLVGWMGGPRVAALAAEPDAALAERALGALAGALHVKKGTVESRLVSWHVHNWSADPYSRGAYSYVRAGGMASLDLAGRPIADTLFFAGEATAPVGKSATVHGALGSGQRAAAEVLRALGVGK